MKKNTILLVIAFFGSITINAQTIASENFETTGLYDLPVGWFANGDFFYDSFVDDYYGGCEDEQYIYTNLFESDSQLFLTSQNYLNLNAGPKQVSYQLRVIDYDDEVPVNYDFGSITFSYSLNDGVTWIVLGSVSEDNFTPSLACQGISYTIEGSLIAAQSNLKFKWESAYSGEGDYEILIDNFMLSESQTASTNELDKSQLKIYPNPVSDVLNIDYSSTISKFIIFDLVGRKIGEFSNSGNLNSIDVSNLSTGTYLLKIQTEDNSQSTIKFIKK